MSGIHLILMQKSVKCQKVMNRSENTLLVLMLCSNWQKVVLVYKRREIGVIINQKKQQKWQSKKVRNGMYNHKQQKISTILNTVKIIINKQSRNFWSLAPNSMCPRTQKKCPPNDPVIFSLRFGQKLICLHQQIFVTGISENGLFTSKLRLISCPGVSQPCGC